MLNLFEIKSKKSLSLFMGLVAFVVMFIPDMSFAAELGVCVNMTGASIFKIVACKVTTTLADVRKIIYVLAGFGLIAFTFAAIFNKISFKHLANIAFSLFLISMLTPFIEYFTGAKSRSPELEYGFYLDPEYSEVDATIDAKGVGYEYAQSSIKTVKGSGITYEIKNAPEEYAEHFTQVKPDGTVVEFDPANPRGTEFAQEFDPTKPRDVAFGEEFNAEKPIDYGLTEQYAEFINIAEPRETVVMPIRPTGQNDEEANGKKTAGGFGGLVDLITGNNDGEPKSALDTIKDIKDAFVNAKNAGDNIIHSVRDGKNNLDALGNAIKNIDNIGDAINVVKDGSRNVGGLFDSVNRVGSTVGVDTRPRTYDENGNVTGGSGLGDILDGINQGTLDATQGGRDAAGIGGAIGGMGEWGDLINDI